MKLRRHDVTLIGNRVTSRPLTEDDWDVLLAWNSDPEILHDTDGNDVRGYNLAQVQVRSASQARVDRHDFRLASPFAITHAARQCRRKQGNSPGADPMSDLRRRALSTWLALLAAAGPFAIGVLPAFGQKQVNLQGQVKGKTGDPKAFARLEFSGAGRYVVVSDGQGRYTLAQVQTGEYTVTVRQGGNFQVFRPKIDSDRLDFTVGW
jgi:Carboxypeptidase regulatory-like domain